MSFNPDLSKQAQEIKFSRRKMKSSHPSVYFNHILVSSISVQKHLGVLLDDKLIYKHHPKCVLNKVKKTIDLRLKFQQIFPRQSLITIYKPFIWPHFDYGYIAYDQAFNESFYKNLESSQYNVAIAITGENKRYVFWENFPRIKPRILKIETLVKKVMFILQNFSWKISLVSFSANYSKE